MCGVGPISTLHGLRLTLSLDVVAQSLGQRFRDMLAGNANPHTHWEITPVATAQRVGLADCYSRKLKVREIAQDPTLCD